MQKLPDDLLSAARLVLEAQKKNVSERIAALSLQDPFVNTDRSNDNASQETEAGEEEGHARAMTLIDALTRELDDVNDALMRIGNGTYGICTNCGNAIDPGRLKILPTATLGLDCERKKK